MLSILKGFDLIKIGIRLLEYVGVALLVWYVYDYIFKKPVRDVTTAYEKKITELNAEVTQQNQALKTVGDKMSICLKKVQNLKDNEKTIILENIYRGIDDMELTGEEDANDTTFNLYHYSF
jgi:hypothetical protein